MKKRWRGDEEDEEDKEDKEDKEDEKDEKDEKDDKYLKDGGPVECKACRAGLKRKNLFGVLWWLS